MRAVTILSIIALTGCGDGGDETSLTGLSATTGGQTSTADLSTSTTEQTTGTTDRPTTDATVTVTATATSSSTGDVTATGSSTGPGPACGDGAVDPGEECDDGPANADDAACTAACTAAVCGDGLVQTGVEECDDGNMDDADACVAGCKNAVCGDGFVGPGEMCDDGNMVDDDACTNTCAPASCGDGKLQMPEECDDGNKVDTDACLGTCVEATCGDGFVLAGMETCDDGNAVESDLCTTLCKAPACDDKLKSGKESDIDCGGDTCAKCDDGKACLVVGDCKSNTCVGMVCKPTPKSCKEVLANDPAAKTGKYTIDLDGVGPLLSQEVYCDMSSSGGGWTIFYGSAGVDNEPPMVGDLEAVVNDPTTFKTYNLNRAKKIALSASSTETILVRAGMVWLRANSAAFDANLAVANKSAKKAIMLTSSDNVAVPAFMGWSNYNLAGGGDFGITLSPDAATCNGVTVTGFDHHSTNYWMLNCGCVRHYFYSYSSAVTDSDAGYEVNTPLGAWKATNACDNSEANNLPFYAAMR